jgi:predicted PurR-regulated permease PerM
MNRFRVIGGGNDPSGGMRTFRPEHVYKGIGLLFLLALLYRFFDEVTRVFLIAFAAAILAVALNQIVRHIPGNRKYVTPLVGLGIFAAIGMLLWFATPVLLDQLRGLLDQIPAMRQQLQAWEASVRERTGLEIQLVRESGSGLSEFIGSLGSGQMLGGARTALEYLVLPLLILFGGLFAVGKPNEHLLTPLLRAVPTKRRPAFRRILELLGTRLWAWVRGMLISMTIIGVLSTIAFYLIGLPYALLLGVWSGLTEFVPLIGPFIGGATAVAVAFMESPDKALWTAVAVLVIQQLESDLITPMVMARVAEVHPFVTLFAIILFGSLFGFLGVLLALPLVLLIWTVVQVLWVERAIDTDEDPIEPVVED